MTLVALILAMSSDRGDLAANVDPMSADQWVSAEVSHLSRTAPAVGRTIDSPVNPSLQLGYHRSLLGSGVLRAGMSLQVGAGQFDDLFWSLSGGGGIEGVYRSRRGVFAALGLRLDYARLFTGTNHFVPSAGGYMQSTDPGRGFLRIGLVDVAIGYSPDWLRRWGVVPAIRYAWLLDLPLYSNEGANPWSYTTLGLSVMWMWEGKR